MAKCVYDCAKCTLEVDKALCCQFQCLRLLVEVKQMIKDAALPPATTKTLADIMEVSNETSI